MGVLPDNPLLSSALCLTFPGDASNVRFCFDESPTPVRTPLKLTEASAIVSLTGLASKSVSQDR